MPGFSGKLAIEATDRAMRGEAAPSPIYEGEDSVIAWMLGGPATEYDGVAARRPASAPRGILETYTKAHSAEYQAQALIDLAIELAPQIADFDAVEEIVVETSHHTHNVIGTGANDPQKFDPDASRETLDHSIMYILAVALEDRRWHHERSYARERAHRPSTIALWRKIRTVEDPVWTARYHEPDPAKRAFGGRISIRMTDGSSIAGEKAGGGRASERRPPVALGGLCRQARQPDGRLLAGGGARRIPHRREARRRASAGRARRSRSRAAGGKRHARCADRRGHLRLSHYRTNGSGTR